MAVHLSKYDNRDLWKRYNYGKYGIIAEPYFDMDFCDVLYLTDTGRRWDGEKVSIRDKVVGQKFKTENQNSDFKKLKLRSTMDIIKAAENKELPDKILINTHPQRWNNRYIPWAKELVSQNIKNFIKKHFFVTN